MNHEKTRTVFATHRNLILHIGELSESVLRMRAALDGPLRGNARYAQAIAGFANALGDLHRLKAEMGVGGEVRGDLNADGDLVGALPLNRTLPANATLGDVVAIGKAAGAFRSCSAPILPKQSGTS